MDRIRAFIALNLPLETIREVKSLQDELRQAAEEAEMRVAWVKPPNMHVTLKFFGDIPVESARAAGDCLLEKLRDRQALRLNVSELGAFPDVSEPRVIWLGIKSDGDALSQLAKEIDDLMEGLGFPPEKREFRAHLTLGRVKEGAADLIGGRDQLSIGDCLGSEIVIYQSKPTRQGAEYTAIERIQLRGAAPKNDKESADD